MNRLTRLLPLFIILFVLICIEVTAKPAFALDAGASDSAKYSDDWRTTGPPGGDVRGLVVDPNTPDQFYFGTLDGQIYASSDGGKRWKLLYNFNRPKLFVDHIIVDPRNSKV